MTRFASRAVEVTLFVAWSMGCGSTRTTPSDTGAVGVDAVCDGTDQLRLLMAVVPQADRVGPTQRLLYENGFYVLIDGRCRYWANSVDLDWAETRTGSLDLGTLASLLAEVRYPEWARLQGEYPSAPGVFDASSLVFMDSSSRILCVGNCGASIVPADVHAMRDAFTPWAQRLWGSGTAVGLDVRMLVFRSGLIGESADRIQASEWPLRSLDLRATAIPWEDAESISFGDGIQLGGGEADALRVLRAEYMAGDHGSWWYGFIPIRDEEGTLHEVYVRDTTPFEDERGLLGWLHAR